MEVPYKVSMKYGTLHQFNVSTQKFNCLFVIKWRFVFLLDPEKLVSQILLETYTLKITELTASNKPWGMDGDCESDTLFVSTVKL